MPDKSNDVSLFIPCLIDQVYPEMGFAMVDVLRALGFTVRYDDRQTCCGQPAFNAGHLAEARVVARHFVDVFGDAGTIVCPSGSCTAMVRNYYDELFAGEQEHGAADDLRGRVFEFSEFLAKAGVAGKIDGHFDGRAGFHNSCHSFRELRLGQEPLDLLRRIEGCEVVLPDGDPVCCGFGGLFSVKFTSIAAAMAKSRLELFIEKNVDVLVSNDPGCIMHMRQEAKARGIDLPILHLAEFLQQAMAEQPA